MVASSLSISCCNSSSRMIFEERQSVAWHTNTMECEFRAPVAPMVEQKRGRFLVPLQVKCFVAGPILGPFSGPLFFRMYADFLSSAANHMKANLTLQLDLSLAQTCCPEGKKTVRMTLDESGIRLWPGAVLSTIACHSKLKRWQTTSDQRFSPTSMRLRKSEYHHLR